MSRRQTKSATLQTAHDRAIKHGCSMFSIENSRYTANGRANRDHSNEDRCFVGVDDRSFKIFGVFDGHDGSNASDLACDYTQSRFKRRFQRDYEKSVHLVEKILEDLFTNTEEVFFKNIQHFIKEKKRITRRLEGLSSYEAYIKFPDLVARLQEIQPLISGGTTAVIAVLIGDTLYVANTGDSRAVLVEETDKGIYVTTQLTVDHTVDNVEELERLQALGLEREQLKKAGRLGGQENTRCIGDYGIKEGYTEVDSISHAIDYPGIAIPSITNEPISSKSLYLLLMTDGVYKTLENMQPSESLPYDPMQDLVKRIQAAETNSSFDLVAEVTLTRMQQDHCRMYNEHVQNDPMSPLAIQCRKRDDMTLIVHKFEQTIKLS